MVGFRTMMRHRRCRQLAAAVVDYATGGLPPGMRERVERHLAHCARCRAAVAAVSDVPDLLSDTIPVRDDAFWSAQRDAVMQSIERGATSRVTPRPVGFDWRLALPIAAALAIALAGYLSLRPPTAPGEIALDALPAEDVSALVEVAGGILPPQELVPLLAYPGDDVRGAVDAGWIRPDDLPPPIGFGELDEGDLEALKGMLG